MNFKYYEKIKPSVSALIFWLTASIPGIIVIFVFHEKLSITLTGWFIVLILAMIGNGYFAFIYWLGCKKSGAHKPVWAPIVSALFTFIMSKSTEGFLDQFLISDGFEFIIIMCIATYVAGICGLRVPFPKTSMSNQKP